MSEATGAELDVKREHSVLVPRQSLLTECLQWTRHVMILAVTTRSTSSCKAAGDGEEARIMGAITTLGLLLLETHRAVGGSHGLPVILIDTHHAQYQELRAMMNRVSQELLGEAGQFDTYCLRIEGEQRSSPALWGCLGPPANIHGNA
eukprot:1137268-Amphidinium_carterae.1